MSILRTLTIAQNWIRAVVKPGETVLDGTVGNGHDLRFLSELVGPKGQVYGFDTQAQAIASTRASFAAQGELAEHIELIHDCHSRLSDYVVKPLRAAMFNLGYLPSGPRDLVTKPETTLLALQHTLEKIEPVGLITIVCYRGHEQGRKESQSVLQWAQTLPITNHFVITAETHNSSAEAPFLIAIEKR